MGQRWAGVALGEEFKAGDPFSGYRRVQYPSIVIDYNSIPYICEFVNMISRNFWKISREVRGKRPLCLTFFGFCAIMTENPPLDGEKGAFTV
jgi:hypothetical protein